MKHNWSYSTIGVELKTSSGGTPNKMYKEFYEGGNIPWLRSGEVCKKNITETEMFITQKGMDNSSAKWFPENTVLVAMYGATAGQVGILRFPSTTNQAICGIFPNDKFLPEFLYYTLLYSKDTLVSQAVGNAQPNISQIKVKEVSLPKISIAEQQRIVDILDKEFEKIDTLKENAEKGLQQAKDLFQSALKQELQPKEGWVIKKLGELCNITSSKRIYKSEYVAEGIPFYRTKEVKEIANGLPISAELFISRERYDAIKQKYGVPQINDMLVSAVGTIGEIMIIKDSNPFYFKDGNLVWLKNISDVIPTYLRYYLKSVIDNIKSLTIGAAYDALTIEKFQEMKICYPIIEQEQIVSRLDKLNEHCNTLQKNYEKTIALCDDMKQALLRKAFNGEF